MSDHPVHPGQVLEGKFRVERIIGEGAMGLVVEATHLHLDERVALKFLRREARTRPDIVTRFAREARAAAKISSDHVARVYDVGGTEDGSPFIVMEFLEGNDLEVVLEKSGPLPIAEAVEYAIHACEGLAAAHARGIVHRDIKPANLFIAERGGLRHIKLLDFGISKAGLGNTFEDIDLGSADTTQIMGSPNYMSPEQIRSTRDVDHRADIWSLGVVLFELVTGQTPFPGTEVTAIIAKVLHDPHQPVAGFRADVPSELVAVIDRCLEKDVTRRYPTAADLAVALLPFAPKRARAVVDRATAIATRATGSTTYPDSLPPPATVSTITRSRASRTSGAVVAVAPAPAGRGPLFWVAVAAVVVGLLGGIFALVVRLRSSTTAETDPAVRPEPVATAPAAPAVTTAPAATTAAAPTTAAVEPAAAPTAEPAKPAAEATATTPTVTTATPTGDVPPVLRRRPRPVGSGAPSVTAPPTDNDIRHER